MWIGRESALRRIADEIQTALEKAYAAHLSSMSDEDKQSTWRMENLAGKFAMRAKATGAGGEDELKGSLEGVLSEMGTQRIERLEFGNLDASSLTGEVPKIEVIFDAGPGFPSQVGVTVEVSGEDAQWVEGVRATLAEKVQANVPWWRFVAAPWFIRGLFFTSALGVLGIISGTADSIDGFEIVLLGLLTAAMTLGLELPLYMLGRMPLVYRVFPAFEVVESDSKGRGRAVIAAAVAVIGLGLGVLGVVLSIVGS